ncbi:MAG: FeoB-associated Cys-rich membrane protein [Firmicutes bacterium]|nr:FeoB-associated Cys-rich membrane protein [Bacillota bacterium]
MIDFLIYAFIISAIGLSIKRIFFHKKKKSTCGGNCQNCQMYK